MNPQLMPPENLRRFLKRGVWGTLLAGGVWLTGRRGQAADGGRNPFAYDVNKYRTTDPKLLRYERVTRYKTPRPSPRRVGLGPEDRLYIAAGPVVSVMDAGGAPVTELTLTGPVRSLSVAADGTLFAGHKNHVEVYDPKGRRLAVWDAPKGKPYLTGMAVGDKDVFVADAGNRVVWRHDRAGRVLGRIGEKNPQKDIPGLVLPSPFLDVEIGADGLLRVNNPGRHRVEVYTFEGDLELAWGKPSMAIGGFCGCCNPVNVSLLPDGRCVTFEKGLPRVKVYGTDGTLECVVAGPESFGDSKDADAISEADESGYGGLDGVVDSLGRVHVLDLLAGDVQVFQPKKEGAA